MNAPQNEPTVTMFNEHQLADRWNMSVLPRLRQFEGQVVDFYGAHVKTLHYKLV